MNKDVRQHRQLSPEQKWEIFLEVTSKELTQADAARKWRVDVSTVIKVRRLAKDAALAAFAASRPGGLGSELLRLDGLSRTRPARPGSGERGKGGVLGA